MYLRRMDMKKIITSLLSIITCLMITLLPIAGNEISTINFTLHSTVYNYGEAIDQVVLDTSNLNIDENSLTTNQFKVLASATSPYTDESIIEMIEADGLQHCGLYSNVERKIEKVEYVQGKITLFLATEKDGAGQGTLDFTANFETAKGCNLTLDIDYTIELLKPLQLQDGSILTNEMVQFIQNDGIINEEIAKFSSGEAMGLKYQLYTPENSNDGNKHPLIVWLHGGGESGYKGILYNNVAQLKANRGAVTFTTSEAQEIFGGAYVLAPQVPDEWSDHLSDTKALIDQIVASYQIDANRIYLYGCSAGGYMTLDLVVHNPDYFAAAVATCPAIDQANIATYGQGRNITDEELLSIKNTPLWLVQAKNDGTVKYEESALRVYNLLKGNSVILTAYDSVQVGDEIYSGGHESWVYTALNMPEYNGEHVWQWCAKQVLPVKESVEEKTPSVESKSETTVSVKTGDDSSLVLYPSLLVVSMSLVGYLFLKKEN